MVGHPCTRVSAQCGAMTGTCLSPSFAGVRASAIHSMMPYDIMRGELTRFRRGELDVLFNVEVSEGAMLQD